MFIFTSAGSLFAPWLSVTWISNESWPDASAFEVYFTLPSVLDTGSTLPLVGCFVTVKVLILSPVSGSVPFNFMATAEPAVAPSLTGFGQR